jgi:hypothetical protein
MSRPIRRLYLVEFLDLRTNEISVMSMYSFENPEIIKGKGDSVWIITAVWLLTTPSILDSRGVGN